VSGGGKSSAGGATSNGGVPGEGGASASTSAGGGANPAGGASASGGSYAAGGSKATGGTKATGGSSTTGGTKATGGSSAAGGTKATGGSSTAGGSSTGGATALPKFVGNITTRNGVDPTGLKYSKYWNQITPENQGKWGSVQSTPSSAFNWGSLDSIYQYAQTNNVIFKQHTFVWGAQQPSGTPTLAQVETWIKSFCQRYPNTKLIDVVNEPPPHTTPSYTSNLGAGEGGKWPWIVKAFKLARQYCGSAILILNDYNNIEYGDQEQHFIDIVKDIKANGAPIDAVGCQSHALKGRSSSQVQTNVDKMANDTGLPVYITEYDIGDASDAVQLTNFQNHFSVFLKTPSIKGITVWGWINGATWIDNSGIVNGTAPRSAMTWLMQQLNRPVPPN
jgi:endo-1,4-beta-xylanase